MRTPLIVAAAVVGFSATAFAQTAAPKAAAPKAAAKPHKFAVERGWLELHESGTYVRLLKTEAAN